MLRGWLERLELEFLVPLTRVGGGPGSLSDEYLYK